MSRRPSDVDVDDRGRGGLPLLAAELALVVVHLTVAYGFVRLYQGRSFLGDLVAVVVAAHLLAAGCRRLRVPVLLTAVIAVAGGAVALTVLLLPDTARWGALPTAATWDAAVAALRESRARFQVVTPPTPVLVGFQLAAAAALWAAAWFADWAAFRLRATAEAVAPGLVVFVFGAILGADPHRIVTAAAFAGAVLVFVAAHRAYRSQEDGHWLGSEPERGPRAALRAGVGLAAVALLAGVVAGPHLPGSGATPILRWRGSTAGGGGDRTTVSPIVDLRKRLVDQRDDVLFTVRTDRRAYLRLTALDRFDGRLWTSDGRFAKADGQLPSTQPERETTQTVDAEIRIVGLAAIWAPAPFEARSLPRASGPLLWDEESSTLIVGRGEETSDGLAYEVVSEVPELDAAQLAAADAADAADIDTRYLELPADFPARARQAAQEATRGAEGRYATALALQDWFRTNFTYSLEVPAGHSDDALVDFLQSREGYCEQFAGAYAAMARSLGLPARVAVGFTPGEGDPNEAGLYRVRGRHAHAWPEVWFPQIGWVAFEPTPGRGMPGAEAYTGVPEAQDDTAPTIHIVTTTAPTTTTPGATPTTAAPVTEPTERAPVAAPTGGAGGEGGGGRSWLDGLLAVAAVAAVALLGAILLAPVRRRLGRRGHDPRQQVLDAWADAADPVHWLTGARASAAETHREFARRTAAALGDLGPSLVDLADRAEAAAWAPAPPPADGPATARAAADALAAEARRRATPWARLARRLSWRVAFDRPKAVGQSSVASGSASSRVRWRRRSPVMPR